MASAYFLQLLHLVGGEVTFLIFAFLCLGALVFIALLVPETKNREPRQIAAELQPCSSCCPYSGIRALSSNSDEEKEGNDDSSRDVQFSFRDPDGFNRKYRSDRWS